MSESVLDTLLRDGADPEELANILGAKPWPWRLIARPEQLAPVTNWRVFVYLAGRSAGKTRSGCEWVLEEVDPQSEVSKARGWHHRNVALISPTSADARDVLVEGPSGIMACSPNHKKPIYEPSKRRLTWWAGTPQEVVGTLYSAEEGDRLRGPQQSLALCLSGDTQVTMGDYSTKDLCEVQAGELVMTRQGARRVVWSGLTADNTPVNRLTLTDGRVIVGTDNHPIWIEGKGFVPLGQVLPGDSACVIDASPSQIAFGTSEEDLVTTSPGCSYIEKSGKRSRGRYPKVSTSITSTESKQTIDSKTSNYCLMQSTANDTGEYFLRTKVKKCGMLPQQRSESSGKNEKHESLNVKFVEECITARLNTLVRTALTVVGRTVIESDLSKSDVSVYGVVKNTQQQKNHRNTAAKNVTSTPLRTETGRAFPNGILFAPSVEQVLNPNGLMPGSAPRPAPKTFMVCVKSIERQKNQSVYDLTVAGAHEFFANGILVHNCDELAAWQDMETYDMMMMGLRLSSDPRVMITTTPRNIPIIKQLAKDFKEGRNGIVMQRGSSYDNSANLPPSYFEQIVAKYEGTHLGRQEIMGEIVDDVEGALWTHDLIDRNRIKAGQEPPMRRVIIGVDPATTYGENSDNTGIVVAGLGEDNHVYVLADYSGKYMPERWARKVVTAYETHGATRIIAEGNQGGAMVESTIKSVAPYVPVTIVHTKTSKGLRAEPVAAMYETGRVHHVGPFPELEEEQCTWEAGNKKSPDRIDALCYSVSSLLLGKAAPSFHGPGPVAWRSDWAKRIR